MTRRPVTSPRATPPEIGAAEAGLVCVGQFGAPHGVRGDIRLRSFMAQPTDIVRHAASLRDASGAVITLINVRPLGTEAELMIARVAGASDRDAAARFTNRLLYLPRSVLPAPDDDEFYLADLIGLMAVDANGEKFGTIVGVPNYGAGDLLEIAPALGGRTGLLPFTKAFAPRIDLAAGRIEIAAPPDLFAAPAPADPDGD